MEREDHLRHFYGLSHSTIVQSPYASARQPPSFGTNFGDFIECTKRPQVLSAVRTQYSANSSGFAQFINGGNEGSTANQYFQELVGTDNVTLTKSTIIQPKDPSNSSWNAGNHSNIKEKNHNLSKYLNTSTPQISDSSNERQSGQSSKKNQGESPKQYPHDSKVSQNFSFQFSPKKGKKSHDQGSIRQFIVVEPKVSGEKNNLENYKKVQLESPTRVKRSISNQVSSNMKFNFNAAPIIAATTSNTQSPNSSFEHNKFLRREFSSGKVNVGFKGTHLESPISNPDTSYLPYYYKKPELKTCPQTPTSTTTFASPVKQDFITVKKLGKGKYGDVFLAQHKYLRLICALKVIPKQTILKEEGGLNQFIREVTIQMYLSNPHLIELWGIFSDSTNVYLIMEPALDGQLYKYMKQRRQLNESETASLIKQLCVGVEYLQSQKVIHRDLKPQNILLHEGKLKICDFGWAVYNQNNFRQTFCGTPLYLSPDVLKGDQYNDKVDNWAIGIITYEMIIGRIPFRITQESEMEKILNQQIQFPQYVPISDTAKDFILSLLERDPDSRMDIEAMLSHKFLTLAS